MYSELYMIIIIKLTIVAQDEPEVPHLAPVLSPRVPDDPVLATIVRVVTPADHANDVVGHFVQHGRIGEYTASVFFNRTGIDLARDWAASENFRLHLVRALHLAVLGDGGIGVNVNGGATTREPLARLREREGAWARASC